MKTSRRRRPAVAKLLIPVLALVAIVGLHPAAAANDKIEMTGAAGIFYAAIIERESGASFQIPKSMASKNNVFALDFGNQKTLPASDIDAPFVVANGVVINGPGGTRAVRADFGGAALVGDRDLFAVVSAPALAEYNKGGSDLNIIPKIQPIGSDLFMPEVNRDFPPRYSELGKNAVWGLNASFGLPSRIGYVGENFFFKVKDAGEPVPPRSIPPPNGTGDTFDFFGAQYDINASYVLFKGSGAFFNGAYTYRISDGITFSVAESYALNFDEIGQINGVFLHNDKEVFFDAGGGLYKGDTEGATPPELVLPNNTGIFGSGLLHDLDGDHAAISGVDNTGGSIIVRVNLADYFVEPLVQKGDVAPGGEIFEIVQRPGLSDEIVVFEAFDSSFKFLGLYGRSLDTWDITPFVRVGDIFDGREVRTVGFQPGAVHGMTVGATVYFTDDSSGAYLMTPGTPFKVDFGQISTRFSVGIGDKRGIGGFVNVLSAPPPPVAHKSGPQSVGAKRVIIRAIGPSLGAFGVQGPLVDPMLEVHLPDNTVLTNDNWRDAQEQDIIDSGLAPTDDFESAIIATIEPGASTAIVSGANGGTGVGLVEIYDLEGPGVSELGNISTRGLVESGENVLIGGIIVNGSDCTASTMVVRAIGPSLADFGVADPLEDPMLELHDGSGALLASNDNWKDTQQSELEDAGLDPSDDREAAIEIALGTGLYTAIVRGAGETSGVALVEAYNLEASGTVANIRASKH